MGWVDAHGNPIEGKRGKRLRPAITLLACEASGSHYDAARPAGAAVELIHNFSLLHDDVQDQSQTRHGRATTWTIWGANQAINTGDMMYALANLAIRRLSGQGTDPALLARQVFLVNDTCLELTRGQHLDMAFETRDEVSVEEYLDMISGKTGALTATSAQIGAIAAGASAEVCEHYRQFGFNLGMAFQIQDDILDIWGDEQQTGKQAAIDIYQRKKSLPVLYGLAQSESLRALYRDYPVFAAAEVSQVIMRLDEVDARGYARELVQRYTSQTLEHLRAAKPAEEAGQALLELVGMLLNRQK
ncbi:MAG: polyprenyl synthetase family protein [Anaerolineae bacterium]|nr:polyprenyl synthetase family protein [Anaerolineae bacterium]